MVTEAREILKYMRTFKLPKGDSNITLPLMVKKLRKSFEDRFKKLKENIKH